MITPDQSQELADSAQRFHEADNKLRTDLDPANLESNAKAYLAARRDHADLIERLESDLAS